MGYSEELFERGRKVIPGGVNSPVRACQSVGMTPRFIEKADRQYIYDVDGRRYTDYICSWGPMILGHNHPVIREAVAVAIEKGLSYGAPTEAEIEMAELICRLVPAVEMVRMVNSGTEAVMSAVRAARGFTGRDRIIKFEGCYHGHADSMLVKAGSGVMTQGVPDSAGVPKGCAADTLTAGYNDLGSVEALCAKHPGEIAAVIVEPVAANMGVVTPEAGFLEGLRKICDENGMLLIFDEVITGFRLGLKGASGFFKVKPDLVTFGKIIGAGMPVGAYGGDRKIMEMVSPVGTVYQAGTLSGNPVAMAAGLAQLRFLEQHPQVYAGLEETGEYLRGKMKALIRSYEMPCTVTGAASLSCLFFARDVRDYASARTSDTNRFAEYYRHMLEGGNYLAPSQFEAIFLSDCHTREDIDGMLSSLESFFDIVQN